MRLGCVTGVLESAGCSTTQASGDGLNSYQLLDLQCPCSVFQAGVKTKLQAVEHQNFKEDAWSIYLFRAVVCSWLRCNIQGIWHWEGYCPVQDPTW